MAPWGPRGKEPHHRELHSSWVSLLEHIADWWAQLREWGQHPVSLPLQTPGPPPALWPADDPEGPSQWEPSWKGKGPGWGGSTPSIGRLRPGAELSPEAPRPWMAGVLCVGLAGLLLGTGCPRPRVCEGRRWPRTGRPGGEDRELTGQGRTLLGCSGVSPAPPCLAAQGQGAVSLLVPSSRGSGAQGGAATGAPAAFPTTRTGRQGSLT